MFSHIYILKKEFPMIQVEEKKGFSAFTLKVEASHTQFKVKKEGRGERRRGTRKAAI